MIIDLGSVTEFFTSPRWNERNRENILIFFSFPESKMHSVQRFSFRGRRCAPIFILGLWLFYSFHELVVRVHGSWAFKMSLFGKIKSWQPYSGSLNFTFWNLTGARNPKILPPGRTFSKQMRISLITALLGRFLKTRIRALSPLFFPCGSLGRDKLIMSLGFLTFQSCGRVLPPRQGHCLTKECALTSSSSLSSQRLPSLKGSTSRLRQFLLL